MIYSVYVLNSAINTKIFLLSNLNGALNNEPFSGLWNDNPYSKVY